jgi:hypothetical protein
MNAVRVGLLGLGVAVATAFAFNASLAATIVKQEPGAGQFRPGTRVLVDDGSCPAGKIKEVVDASSPQVAGGKPVAGLRRIRHCIKR